MHCRALLLLLVPTLTGIAWGQDSEESGTPECRTWFTRDDPALFEFVDTRESVDFDRFAGKTLAGIEYVVLPIFNEDDPEENNWFFRTANDLHINTRESTVERQMIVEPGNPLDPQLLRENERLLRRNSYLVDAMILPHRVCGERIHLLAVVRDVWTLTPSTSVSRSGGENQSSAELIERNLLGTGQQISLGYFDDADRSGGTFSYTHPYILGQHTKLNLDLEDNTDGELQSVQLIRPFFQLDSKREASAAVRRRRRLITIAEDDEVINKYRRNTNFQSAHIGWSAGRQDDTVHRWRLGLTNDETVFNEVDHPASAPPEDQLLRYPWIQWTSIEDRFTTLQNITHSHRHEDILLGFFHEVRLGYAREDWESTENAWLFSLDHEYTASLGDHHLLRLGASADGRYNVDFDRPEETEYTANARYYQFPDARNRWFTRLRYSVGRNFNDNAPFSSGGSDSLRGYPNDIQRGNRQWLFTLERRHFTDIHLFKLVYLGGAAYLDAGRTWTSEDPQSHGNPVLSNFGLGLRATPSKFNVDEVLHLDIAWPLAERDRVDNFQIIVSGEADF